MESSVSVGRGKGFLGIKSVAIKACYESFRSCQLELNPSATTNIVLTRGLIFQWQRNTVFTVNLSRKQETSLTQPDTWLVSHPNHPVREQLPFE
jgi:hypothetical protein